MSPKAQRTHHLSALSGLASTVLTATIQPDEVSLRTTKDELIRMLASAISTTFADSAQRVPNSAGTSALV
jgi:hypothetical protein